MSWLADPLGYEFFRLALTAAVLVGIVCGLLGVFIVVRGLSYIGHGLSHAAFGGAVAGYLLAINIHLAAGVAAVLAALLIQRISDGRRVKADAAIGIVTTAMFALGVALVSWQGRFTKSFEAALFGNILGVTTSDLLVVAVVTLLVLALILSHLRQLLFAAFDEETAAVFGVPVKRLRLGLSLLLAGAVISAMNIVGVTMIAAALVIPAATARMLSDRLPQMLLIAPLLGAATGVCGLYASFYLDTASGASIVLTGAALFGVAWGWRSWLDRHALHAHAHRHGTVEHSHAHTHAGDHDHPHHHQH
jgi:manganese/iron transport system permease protein/iron/zinc/copper transport system permease protein